MQRGHMTITCTIFGLCTSDYMSALQSGLVGCSVNYDMEVNGTSTMLKLKLSDFGISEETGFLPPSPPLGSLPECFSRWESLVRELPRLVEEGRLREEVHRLPEVEFSEKTLQSEEEWRRAYVVLTFLSQSYIWAEGESGVTSVIPKLLAVPWCEVSDHLGIPPIITYSASVLNNWGLVDATGPMDISNLHTLTSFTGSRDESWFNLTHVQVEIEAVPGLKAVAAAHSTMKDRENTMLLEHLQAVQKSLQGMQRAVKGMSQHCNPSNFYVNIRPFLAGSKGLDVFPQGIIYEGTDPPLRQYHGSSAAQSTTIQAFDIFLGAERTGTDAKFLVTMRDYMPPKHREFLSALAALPSVREYIKGCEQQELMQCYNSAVQALADFRTEHLILATRYITMQKRHSKNASLETKGTGGTDFTQFLKKVRDETLSLRL